MEYLTLRLRRPRLRIVFQERHGTFFEIAWSSFGLLVAAPSLIFIMATMAHKSPHAFADRARPSTISRSTTNLIDCAKGASMSQVCIVSKKTNLKARLPTHR